MFELKNQFLQLLKAVWLKKKISFYNSFGAVWTEKSVFTAPKGLFGLKNQVLWLLRGCLD